MARITIEDCMEHVPNRFHLVRMASIRAKQLKKGARPLLISEENKEVVMSLREIAAGLIKPGNAEVPVAEPIAAAVAESPAEPVAASGPVAGEAGEASEAPQDAAAATAANPDTPQEA